MLCCISSLAGETRGLSMKTTRKIGNYHYYKFGNTDSKREAQRMARYLRDNGHKVRIIHEKQGSYLILTQL